MKDKLPESIFIVAGNIADKHELDQRNIDTIINAANPSLMGSSQGVDGAIHKSIDGMNDMAGYFRDHIYEELKTEDRGDHYIRCQRGEAVLTAGYGLCKYVIHVVGAKYDGGTGIIKQCSGSAIRTLEACYDNIVKLIKEHSDIQNIAIPIISSGEYGFPFQTAVKIAITSVYNAIVDWKQHDPEIFEMSGLEKIYFFIYDTNQESMDEKLRNANKILQEYKPIMEKEKRIVFQSSWEAHLHDWKEVIEYDESRGYFSGAKRTREMLMLIRSLFVLPMLFKNLFGGRNWEKRRQFVERYAMYKALLPIIFYLCCEEQAFCPFIRNVVFPFIVVYHMCDTVTYLLALMVMADIQRPSANIIRSMIMLFVNYIQVSFGISFLYYLYYAKCGWTIPFMEAIAFGILGIRENSNLVSGADYTFTFVEAASNFFFITLAFGYFANHMHQRKFRS